MPEMISDPRRAQPVTIEWTSNAIGRLSINGEFWAAVEWSEKRQAWCIEDAEGRCLSHAASICGQAAAKDEAIDLALVMIRDGRLASPQEAREARRARREKRRNQPAQRRKAEESRRRQKEESALLTAAYSLKFAEEDDTPLYELLATVFDFSDPNLWKSNAFATLRPRLVKHVTPPSPGSNMTSFITVDAPRHDPFGCGRPPKKGVERPNSDASAKERKSPTLRRNSPEHARSSTS